MRLSLLGIKQPRYYSFDPTKVGTLIKMWKLPFSSLSLLACTLSQTSNRVQVEVQRRGRTFAAVDLSEAFVQASAENFRYDATSGVWKLNGHCVVTITRLKKPSSRFEPQLFESKPWEFKRFESDTASIKAQTIERQVASDSPIDFPNLPLSDLASALKQDENCPLFRLTWSYSMGDEVDDGTAFYDRRSHTVKEEFRRADRSNGRGDIYRSLYAKVDDKMIYEAAQKLGRKGSGPFDFGQLLSYGAVRHTP